MAGTGPSDLYDLCAAFLSASIDALDTIPNLAPGLGGAPERAFVSASAPALDCCDQLTVHANPIREAPTPPLELGTGTRARQQFRINHVGLAITITRCISESALNDFPPAVADLQAVAEQADADAWALWNYLWNLMCSGALRTLCSGVFFDSLVPVPSSGGCSGWVLNLRIELEGYEGI